MRRALKEFYYGGDTRDARKALGHFARRSMKSGAAAADRLARAAHIGAAVFSAISGASVDNPAISGALDLRTLTGRPISEAITTIIDTFCAPGILDEEAIRICMGEALAEAFSGLDTFDSAAIDSYAAVVALRTFVAEMVFVGVMLEQGQAASGISPQQAVSRENDIRDIIRELTDVKATPVLQEAGPGMPQKEMEILIGDISRAVYQEIAEW